MAWRIVHPSFTMTGTGVVPMLDNDVLPPVTPPVTPPVIPPIPPVEGPFNWPVNQSFPYEAYERTTHAWRIPGREPDDPQGTMYAISSAAGNPAGSASHGNAGIIQSGQWEGDRLFAPWNSPPSMIRQVLKGLLP